MGARRHLGEDVLGLGAGGPQELREGPPKQPPCAPPPVLSFLGHFTVSGCELRWVLCRPRQTLAYLSLQPAKAGTDGGRRAIPAGPCLLSTTHPSFTLGQREADISLKGAARQELWDPDSLVAPQRRDVVGWEQASVMSAQPLPYRGASWSAVGPALSHSGDTPTWACTHHLYMSAPKVLKTAGQGALVAKSSLQWVTVLGTELCHRRVTWSPGRERGCWLSVMNRGPGWH